MGTWVSGLNQHPAKMPGGESCPEGSNPSVSAKSKYFFESLDLVFISIKFKLGSMAEWSNAPSWKDGSSE